MCFGIYNMFQGLMSWDLLAIEEVASLFICELVDHHIDTLLIDDSSITDFAFLTFIVIVYWLKVNLHKASTCVSLLSLLRLIWIVGHIAILSLFTFNKILWHLVLWHLISLICIFSSIDNARVIM